MAIAADASFRHALRALRRPERERDPRPACLACGRPVDPDASVRLHGDSFHPDCALYRGEGRRTA